MFGGGGNINVDIKFDRANKTYHEKEVVKGAIVILTKSEVKHEGIFVDVEGSVRMQMPSKGTSVLDAISTSSSIKPMVLFTWNTELSKPGRIFPGKTELEFEFTLEPKLNKSLFESYHGVYIVTQYLIKCDIKRSFPQKSTNKTAEFLVEWNDYQQTEKAIEKPVAFTITPESVANKELFYQQWGDGQGFNVTGRLDSNSCLLGHPLSGEITVHRSEIPIKSIELQLIRVETCGLLQADRASTEFTEVQTLQIADGDIARGIPIPIYMVFPRLFVCATTETPNFGIEFELNVVMVFANDYMIKESFPLSLHRW